MSVENEAMMAIIRERLRQDHRMSAQSIDVCCCDGHVSLVGLVDSAEHRKLALQIVSGLIGVRVVSDELFVRAMETPAATASARNTSAAA